MSDEENSSSQSSEAGPGGTGVVTEKEARQWGMFAHLSAFAGFVIPFGNIIGPLIIWQMKKDLPFVDEQGKEALNFQITVSISVFVCMILTLVLIGLLLLPLVVIGSFVFTIIAALNANNGENYRYPIAIRLIK